MASFGSGAFALAAVLFVNFAAMSAAQAAPPSGSPAPSSAPAQDPSPAAPPDDSSEAPEATQEVEPPKAEQRETSLNPKAAEAETPGRITFDIDPFADSAMIAVSLGFAGTLELINSTGEIRPQAIPSSFDSSHLIWIDRSSITRKPDPKATGYSTIGLGAAIAFAALDPIFSGLREHSVQTGLADAFMYAETVSFTFAITDLTKMAVRRPRPIAYMDAAAHAHDKTPYVDTTDSALSFFSGHAAIVSSIGATATYLAFARAPHSARPWITLAAGAALTTFVSIERVRAGKHFPTDVIAGSIAGAGIGVVVPHLHRTEDIKQRRVWVGFAPLTQDHAHGGVLNVSGVF